MSPLIHALICKFVALQLAVEIMHGPVFVILHGSSKTNSGFFPCVSTANSKCWGKNGQGESLRDTLHKEHSTLHNLAGLCGLKSNSKSLVSK